VLEIPRLTPNLLKFLVQDVEPGENVDIFPKKFRHTPHSLHEIVHEKGGEGGIVFLAVKNLPSLFAFRIELRKDASHNCMFFFPHRKSGAIASKEIEGESSFKKPKLGIGNSQKFALFLEAAAQLLETAAILLDGTDKGIPFFLQEMKPPAHGSRLPSQEEKLFPSNRKRHS